MEDLIEDIKSEIEILVTEAYNRGLTEGSSKQLAINKKLENPKTILNDFIKHVKKFRISYADGERRFSDDEFIYTDDSFINTFLLKHDYYGED